MVSDILKISTSVMLISDQVPGDCAVPAASVPQTYKTSRRSSPLSPSDTSLPTHHPRGQETGASDGWILGSIFYYVGGFGHVNLSRPQFSYLLEENNETYLSHSVCIYVDCMK